MGQPILFYKPNKKKVRSEKKMDHSFLKPNALLIAIIARKKRWRPFAKTLTEQEERGSRPRRWNAIAVGVDLDGPHSPPRIWRIGVSCTRV
jgi:hypothetical protein